MLFYSPQHERSAEIVRALIAFGQRDRFVIVNVDKPHTRPPYVTSVPYVVTDTGAHLVGADAVSKWVAAGPKEEETEETAGGGLVEGFLRQEMTGFSDGYSYLANDATLPHQFDFLHAPASSVISQTPGTESERKAALPSMDDILASRDLSFLTRT